MAISIGARRMERLRPGFFQMPAHILFQLWMYTCLAADDESGFIDIFTSFRFFQCNYCPYTCDSEAIIVIAWELNHTLCHQQIGLDGN